LFQRVGLLPLSHSSYNLQMSRMLTLLDMAIASSAQVGKTDLLSCITQLWKSAYRDWLAISTQWEGIAETPASAVETEGARLAQIVAEKGFANSYCRRLIDQGQRRCSTAWSRLDRWTRGHVRSKRQSRNASPAARP
jgi:hypothetical protein